MPVSALALIDRMPARALESLFRSVAAQRGPQVSFSCSDARSKQTTHKAIFGGSHDFVTVEGSRRDE